MPASAAVVAIIGNRVRVVIISMILCRVACGVATSVGSACQAKKGGISPALVALGLDEDEARRVLRLSFSRTSSEDDVHGAISALAEVERILCGPTGALHREGR